MVNSFAFQTIEVIEKIQGGPENLFIHFSYKGIKKFVYLKVFLTPLIIQITT